MQKPQLAFFGTPDFSATFLEKLLTDHDNPVEVKFVVTQPDKKVGRKQVVTPTPVKVIAQKYNIPVINNLEFKIQNSALNSKSRILNSKSHSEFSILNSKLQGVDLALLYAFGEIIPQKLLNIPPYGFWNIHPSLLPRYRGPSPIATPIINGDTQTGVTLMQMDHEMDHGPIIAQAKVAIAARDRRPDMEKKLTEAGHELFKQELRNIGIKELRMKEQDHSKATYTKRLTKDDGFIESSQFTVHSSQEAREIFNKFRGLYPWPGIWTKIKLKVQSEKLKVEERRLKITDMDFVNGQLIIKKVQLEGKNEVDFETFKRAYEW